MSRGHSSRSSSSWNDLGPENWNRFSGQPKHGAGRKQKQGKGKDGPQTDCRPPPPPPRMTTTTGLWNGGGTAPPSESGDLTVGENVPVDTSSPDTTSSTRNFYVPPGMSSQSPFVPRVQSVFTPPGEPATGPIGARGQVPMMEPPQQSPQTEPWQQTQQSAPSPARATAENCTTMRFISGTGRRPGNTR